MRIPRTRGAVSGLLLMILGAWGALAPFIGPYFDLAFSEDKTWQWTSGRLWLSVIPGVTAFVGGLLLTMSAHRARAGLGAWMAVLAGAWFVVGPTVSFLWNDGVSATGSAVGGTTRRVIELLAMYDGVGVLIAILGAFALGRLAIRSVRDVELSRKAELAADPMARRHDERFARGDREPASVATDRGAATAPSDRDAATTRPVADEGATRVHDPAAPTRRP